MNAVLRSALVPTALGRSALTHDKTSARMLVPTRRKGPISHALVALLLLAAWLPGAQVAAAPVSAPAAASNNDLAHQQRAFADLPQTIVETFTDVESVVVVRGGQVLFEYYKSGTNQDTLRNTESVTKSILSLLVGIAVDQGAISSLDQPVAALLPAGTTTAREPDRQPTVKHLLTMTAGYVVPGRLSRADSDSAKQLANRPMKAQPGVEFLYDNLAANLLAIAVENATVRGAADFAQQDLFAPLGIDAFTWQKGPNGHNYGSSGLSLRTRDMAKIGQLMLQEGRWNDRQIVSKAYASEAVRRQTSDSQPPYGYMWWLTPSTGGRRTFFASGFGGQLVWVHPPLDLVIATTAATTEGSQARGHAMKLIRDTIFPLVAKPSPAK
jgi:CubicO group peptidase (beta-lactamase class C family)